MATGDGVAPAPPPEGGGGGTVVRLPPAPAVAATTTTAAVGADPSASGSPTGPGSASSGAAAAPPSSSSASSAADVDARIAVRASRASDRRRELLLEARADRIAWIRGDGRARRSGSEVPEAAVGGGGGGGGGRTLLGSLRACRPGGSLPAAPRAISAMVGGGGRRADEVLRRLLEREGLSWDAVASSPREDGRGSARESTSGSTPPSERRPEASSSSANGIDPPLVPDPVRYAAFLDVLCDPPAADLVASIKKFCKTIEEASGVMVSSLEEEEKELSKESSSNEAHQQLKKADSTITATSTSSSKASSGHAASLAKAVKGFLKKTAREAEEREEFRDFLGAGSGSGEGGDAAGPSADAKEQLGACLEAFAYGKIRRSVDAVLEAERIPDADGTKAAEERDRELHLKMRSLQFATPAHLEIGCLTSRGIEDADLSNAVERLRSVERADSPRQMLRSILGAHRAVVAALNAAAEVGGGGDPPGADDVLPALILALLRAAPPGLPSALRLVETFAHPSSIRGGEGGYALANLCGALQFVRELDVEGHLAEVTLGGMGEGAVLHLSPEDFRKALEGRRRRMREEEEEEKREEEERMTAMRMEVDGSGVHPLDAEGDGVRCDVVQERPVEVRIAARRVREARLNGEAVDLAWALRVPDDFPLAGAKGSASDPLAATLPPEDPPLPPGFARSYRYLSVRPESVGVRDVPRLLNEYRSLVRATEALLAERTEAREAERRRRRREERARLEGACADVGVDVGGDGGAATADGR
ncbi:hypothetical protein ACHAWF_017667 [Thalassiosira exigua]